MEYARLEPVATRFRGFRGSRRELAAARDGARTATPRLRALAEEELAALEARLGAEDAELHAAAGAEGLRTTTATSSSRSAPAPAATRRRSSPATCFACTRAMPSARAGRSRCCRESPGEHGGYKEVISRIVGRGAYSRLKFESGTHRVQRVPETEAQGRIHTSACTVAILPELDEVEEIDTQPGRPAHRHLPRLRRRRPARQQDRLGDPHHPPAERHRRRVPGRALAAQEPRAGDVAAAGAAARRGAREAGRASRRRRASCRSAAATAPSASAPTTSRRAA